jgi:hypothetical protein
MKAFNDLLGTCPSLQPYIGIRCKTEKMHTVRLPDEGDDSRRMA